MTFYIGYNITQHYYTFEKQEEFNANQPNFAAIQVLSSPEERIKVKVSYSNNGLRFRTKKLQNWADLGEWFGQNLNIYKKLWKTVIWNFWNLIFLFKNFRTHNFLFLVNFIFHI